MLDDQGPATTSDQTIDTVRAICRAVEHSKDRLCALDAALGDGDHGVSMSKSFRAVEEQLGMMAGQDLGSVLRQISTTMLTTVGGAMAPLFGAAFLEASRAADQAMSRRDPSVSGDLIAAMIEAGRDGVAARGGAHVGDKTMLDALDGAVRTARSASVRGEGASGTLTAAAEGAEAGAAATREMLATVGRASRLGARSLGHVDPGATSVAIILRAAADHLNGRRSS